MKPAPEQSVSPSIQSIPPPTILPTLPTSTTTSSSVKWKKLGAYWDSVLRNHPSPSPSTSPTSTTSPSQVVREPCYPAGLPALATLAEVGGATTATSERSEDTLLSHRCRLVEERTGRGWKRVLSERESMAQEWTARQERSRLRNAFHQRQQCLLQRAADRQRRRLLLRQSLVVSERARSSLKQLVARSRIPPSVVETPVVGTAQLPPRKPCWISADVQERLDLVERSAGLYTEADVEAVRQDLQQVLFGSQPPWIPLPPPQQPQPSLHQPSLHQPSLLQPSLQQPSLHQPSLPQPSLQRESSARYSMYDLIYADILKSKCRLVLEPPAWARASLSGTYLHFTGHVMLVHALIAYLRALHRLGNYQHQLMPGVDRVFLQKLDRFLLAVLEGWRKMKMDAWVGFLLQIHAILLWNLHDFGLESPTLSADTTPITSSTRWMSLAPAQAPQFLLGAAAQQEKQQKMHEIQQLYVDGVQLYRRGCSQGLVKIPRWPMDLVRLAEDDLVRHLQSPPSPDDASNGGKPTPLTASTNTAPEGTLTLSLADFSTQYRLDFLDSMEDVASTCEIMLKQFLQRWQDAASNMDKRDKNQQQADAIARVLQKRLVGGGGGGGVSVGNPPRRVAVALQR